MHALPSSGPVFVLDARWRLLAVPMEPEAAEREVADGHAIRIAPNVVVLVQEVAQGWTDAPSRVLARGMLTPETLRRTQVPWAPKGPEFERLVEHVDRINRFGTVAVFDATGRLTKTPMLAPRADGMVRDGHATGVDDSAIQLRKTLGPEALAPEPAGYLPWRLVDPARLRGRLAGPYADETLDLITAWNVRFGRA